MENSEQKYFFGLKQNKIKQTPNKQKPHDCKFKIIILSICLWKWFTFKPESENSLKWRRLEKEKKS